MTRDDFYFGLFLLISQLWLIAGLSHPDYRRGGMVLVGCLWLVVLIVGFWLS
jgi:hypothetical protein